MMDQSDTNKNKKIYCIKCKKEAKVRGPINENEYICLDCTYKGGVSNAELH